MVVNIYQPNSGDSISLAELALYNQVMSVRVQNGKAILPLSKSLSTTGNRHLVDIAYNFGFWEVGEEGEAPMHGWSDARYDGRDQSTMPSMWTAPQRLGTIYPSEGYEIAAFSDNPTNGWINSPPHLAAILGDFKVFGIAIHDQPPGFYTDWNGQKYTYNADFKLEAGWFGRDEDPAGPPDIVGTSTADGVTLTAFADRFLAGDGNDTAIGSAGNDVIYGNLGADAIYGNQDNDFLYGGQGVDKLFGGQGEDAVYGNLESDVIYGNLGNDQLFGGQGNDTMFGGQGDDWLNGNLGNDTLYGNAGADRFVFRAGGGQDVVADFRPEQGDRINLASGGTFTVSATQVGAAVLTLVSGDTLTLAGILPQAFDAAWVVYS